MRAPEAFANSSLGVFFDGSEKVWKKTQDYLDYCANVKCKCEKSCSENCPNRAMLYQCDAMNCQLGKADCTNRALAKLTNQNEYPTKVNLIKTANRGHGICASERIETGDMILMYVGEIITEAQRLRRRETLKANKRSVN